MSQNVINTQTMGYTEGMQTGRPTEQKRTVFGQRLYEARTLSGMSQIQAAEHLGISQPGYASWERGRNAVKPEQLEQLAKLFDLPVTFFFSDTESKKRGGPAGRAKQLFEKVSKLPRSKQRRVLDVLETILAGEAARS